MRTAESNKKNQQTCKRCGKIVGCDYRSRKHKCDCGNRAGAFIIVPDGRNYTHRN